LLLIDATQLLKQRITVFFGHSNVCHDHIRAAAKKSGSALAVRPPIKPMLAKLGGELPVGDYLYEPKWDGFRAIVFRSDDDVYIQSRDARPLDRYFPDLHATLLRRFPANSVLDGEIVIATKEGWISPRCS
jgi:ATP-dependent DNA ligase